MGFFRQNLEGSYISEMAPTRRFLKGFFTFFFGRNTHDFVRNDPKLHKQSLFDTQFYGA